jgi:hypothetical protein
MIFQLLLYIYKGIHKFGTGVGLFDPHGTSVVAEDQTWSRLGAWTDRLDLESEPLDSIIVCSSLHSICVNIAVL